MKRQMVRRCMGLNIAVFLFMMFLSVNYIAYADENLTYSAADGNTYSYIIDAGDVYIQGAELGEGKKELIIPTSIDGMNVNGISDSAFKDNEYITSVAIPDGVTQIGKDAFNNCTAIEDVEMSDSVQSIGSAAFYNCTSLESIVLPENINNINTSIFQNCSSLSEITIPAGVTIIDGWAFCGCSSLSEVTFASGSKLQQIGRQAFNGCGSLSEIRIPEDFSTISYDSFKDDAALKDVYFYGDISTVTFINWEDVKFSAFYGCSDVVFHAWSDYYTGGTLEDYVDKCSSFGFSFLPIDTAEFVAVDGNTYGYSVNAGDATIENITFSEGKTAAEIPAVIGKYNVNSIAEDAFKDNIEMTSAIIPEGVKEIGKNAFSGCTSLETIDIADSVESIGSAAFYNCSSLNAVDLPKGLKSNINASVFQLCTGLLRINIPEGVSTIDGWAFYGCTSLQSVYFNGKSKLTSIGRQAFNECTSLSEIHIPEGFNSIAYDSFKNDTSLKNVYFYGDVSDVTFINWGQLTTAPFYGCKDVVFHGWNEYYADGNLEDYVNQSSDAGFSFKELDENCVKASDNNTYTYTAENGEAIITGVVLTGSTDLVIPSEIKGSKVVEIGDTAFRGMGDTVEEEKPIHPYTDITSVVIPEGVTIIGTQAFYGCTSIKSISIPETVSTIRSGAFCYCYNLEELVLPESLEGSIGDIFAWGCLNLKSVNIPEGITSIGRWAFYNCQKIQSITIPSTVNSIDKEAFEQCYDLVDVKFADNSQCKSIGQQVFWNCNSLKNINLPDSLTFIGVETFRNCLSLEEISIPSDVTSIGIKAFKGCSDLKTVRINCDLNYVDDETFSNESSLSDIWFYGDIHSIGFHKNAFDNTQDVVFHAYETYAESLKQYVDKYASIKKFSYKAIELNNEVSFSGGEGAEGTMPSMEKVMVGDKFILPENTFTKSGYTFIGWSDGKTVFKSGTEYEMGNENIIFTAVWSKDQSGSSGSGGSGGSSSTATYKINVNSVTNGAISSSNDGLTVKSNGNITINFVPDEGYEVGEVTIDGFSFGKIDSYTFTKVTSGHTVNASFVKKSGENEVNDQDTSNKTSFDDISSNRWSSDAISYVSENGLFSGISDKEFGPTITMSRAMLVTVLYRIESKNNSTANTMSKNAGFEDVVSGAYYEEAVNWAYENKIINGVDVNHFSPDADISREQLAVILYRYALLKSYATDELKTTADFDDASDISTYAVPAMSWAVNSGIINGSDNKLMPRGKATREQVAAMVQRFCKTYSIIK